MQAALSDGAARAVTFVEDNTCAVAVVGSVTALGAVAYWQRRKARKSYQTAPGTFQLGTGNVARGDVKGEVRRPALQ